MCAKHASSRLRADAKPFASSAATSVSQSSRNLASGSGHAVGQRFVPESSYHVVDQVVFGGVGVVHGAHGYIACARDLADAQPGKTRFAGNREGGVEDLLFADDGFVAHAHLPRAEARDPVVSLIVEEDSCVAREEMVVDFRPSLPPSAGLSNMNVVH